MEDGKHELSRKQEPVLGYCNTGLIEELFSFLFFLWRHREAVGAETTALHQWGGI